MEEQSEQLDDLIEMVTGVSYFLDENLRQQFFEATGAEVDPEDERVDILAMFVIANAVLKRISENREFGEQVIGENAEKLQWTRDLVRQMAQSTLTAIVNDPARRSTWQGPDDEDLLSFAYAAIAATHANGLIVALDLLAEQGLDAISGGPQG